MTPLREVQRDRDTIPHLPLSLTSFVGREREVAEVRRCLRSARLVTLTGPPGVGKTRLAREAVANFIDEFPDGVHFIPLATIRDETGFLTAIAQALDLDASGWQSPIARLIERLRTQRRLMVLDNFEQVAIAAPLVAELLEGCSLLAVLVTSRTRLRVRGEYQIVVPPLTLLAPGDLTEPDNNFPTWASRSDAVRLFVERARGAGSDVVSDPRHLAAVVEICRAVEGLPLSIELAAAWCHILTPIAILTRMKSRLAFLTSGATDLPPRQQTLRDAIDWSYDLLSAPEQEIFRRLAIFVGTFSLEAAEAIGEATLESLTALVDKSLVRLDRREAGEIDGEPRFGMLETIREYALERLTASGETTLMRGRHASYFLALATTARESSQQPEQAAWIDRLETEQDNLRAALRFLLDDGDADHALQLSNALQWFWTTRSFCWPVDAYPWLAELNSLARSAGGPKDQTQILLTSGHVAFHRGDYLAARPLFEEGLIRSRQAGDDRGVADALALLGLIARARGSYALAESLSQESLQIFRALMDESAIGAQLDRVGMSRFHQGDVIAARSLLEESLDLRRKVGDPIYLGWSLLLLGQLAHHNGDYLTAHSLYEQSLDAWRKHSYASGLPEGLLRLGDLNLDEGDLAAARSSLIEGLQLSYAQGDWEIFAHALECLGGLAAMGAAPERACRLAGAAAELRETTDLVCSPDVQSRTTRRLSVARERLGEEAAARAMAEGRAMTLRQAFELARDWSRL